MHVYAGVRSFKKFPGTDDTRSRVDESTIHVKKDSFKEMGNSGHGERNAEWVDENVSLGMVVES